MATVEPVELTHAYKGRVRIYKWEGFSESDTCAPVVAPQEADKSLVIEGTFNGGTCLFKGTTNPESGATLYSLNDGDGNALTYTAAKIEEVRTNAYQMAPVISAGSGVLLDAYLLAVGD